MNKNAAITQIQICLLTYRRPDLLKQTLQSLLAQTAISDPGILAHILVIDNHDAQSGRAAFDEVLQSSLLPARYICEPARGLSVARNRALDESAGMNYVAFIDDDEVAAPDWLERLLAAAHKYDVPVVTGPVWPRHLQSPDWVVRGGFFAAAEKPTGTEVGCVATNNLLLRDDVVAAFRFDSCFDSTGGEDTEYSMRIRHAGNRMIWVNEAIVSEAIPPSRANARWLLRRARSDANRYTRGCLAINRGMRTVARRLVVACGGFLAGVGLLPLGLFGRQHSVRALQLISRSVGTVSALLGRNQIFYGPSHG